MRILASVGLILFSISISLTSKANLIGGFESSEDQINFDILDYQPKNHLSMNFYLEGSSDSRLRHVFFYLNVETYLELFLSDQEVSGSFETGSESTVVYSGSGLINQRDLTFEVQMIDDDGSIALKDVVTVHMNDGWATVKIEAYRRRQFFGWVGPLKKWAETESTDLRIESEGVHLYGSNRGHKIGTVISVEGLRNAASDTSTEHLIDACEVDCF